MEVTPLKGALKGYWAVSVSGNWRLTFRFVGEVLKDGVMVEGATVTDLAKQLGVTRVALSRVLNAHAGISAEMAIKLARVFGGSAESWLYMQANYDLWQAERRVVKHNKRAHVAA